MWVNGWTHMAGLWAVGTISMMDHNTRENKIFPQSLGHQARGSIFSLFVTATGYISMVWIACVRTRISSCRGMHARAYATRLRSVHLFGGARRTHVRRSRHYLLRPEGQGSVSCPGLGVRDTSSMLWQWSVHNRKFRIRGFYYMRAYIPHALSVL
ncbi:hypothetical protein CRG98_010793 [Punica granatum]|uniref:Uncharacterized protein n=1 Tax=Punica granatum TaxID=22663 RepID=A0A2I0KLP3_PUNGR|nr:hypothetical protein CRG98_010793 [Punica granatum]